MQVATFEIRSRITINNVSTSLLYLCETQATHYARGSQLEIITHTIIAQPKKGKRQYDIKGKQRYDIKGTNTNTCVSRETAKRANTSVQRDFEL